MSKYFTQSQQFKRIKNEQQSSISSSSVGGTIPVKMAGKVVHYQSAAGGSSNNITPEVAANKLPERMSPPTLSNKLSTHLLDHGYGATPQPQFVREPAAGSGKAAAGKSTEYITNYYKVNKMVRWSVIIMVLKQNIDHWVGCDCRQ